jgi:hypothetical protein
MFIKRMLEIVPIQSLGVSEHRSRFFERNAVFPQIGEGLGNVPREHLLYIQ